MQRLLAQRTAVVLAAITLAPADSEILRSAASMRGRLAAELAEPALERGCAP